MTQWPAFEELDARVPADIHTDFKAPARSRVGTSVTRFHGLKVAIDLAWSSRLQLFGTTSRRQERAMARAKEARNSKRWSHEVKTVSTFPPESTFTKDAESIAKIMASKKVSPKGIGARIRMIQFVINRAAKNLPADRKKELEKAKQILQAKARKAREEK
jgi:hypothetical protein